MDDARLTRTRTRVAAVAVLALTVLLAAVIAARGVAHQGTIETGPDDVEISTEAAVVPIDEDDGGRVDAAGPVALPTGSSMIDEFPVGFPPTELGSVATAVALSRSQIGFDYATASRAARAYGHNHADALVARSRQAVAQRRTDLGVAVRGPVPAPTSFALTPYAFRVIPIDTGRHQVDVLSLVSSTNARGAMVAQLYVGTQVVAWSETSPDQPDLPAEGDWKVTDPTADDLAHFADNPAPAAVRATATKKLLDLGWTTITSAGSSQ